MANPMLGEQRLEIGVLDELVPGAVLKSKIEFGDLFLCVDKTKLLDVLRALKDDERLEYSYFSECVGVDYSAWTHPRDFDERFEVVYNLMSLKHYSRVFVKVGVNDGETIPTAKGVFLGADYPEKEVADLFGIVFEGNELREGLRFMLPDDWVGYPLRKEYPLGGEDVNFAEGDRGPAVEDVSTPHAGESWEGKTGSENVSGR